MLAWLYKWGAIIGGALATAAALIFYGRRQGEEAEQTKDEAREGKALDAVVTARREAEAHVSSLPQQQEGEMGDGVLVAPAHPPVGTAADELRRDWSRD